MAKTVRTGEVVQEAMEDTAFLAAMEAMDMEEMGATDMEEMEAMDMEELVAMAEEVEEAEEVVVVAAVEEANETARSLFQLAEINPFAN